MRDLEEVPKDILSEMKVHLVSRVDEVLPLVLEPPAPAPPAPPEPVDDGASAP